MTYNELMVTSFVITYIASICVSYKIIMKDHGKNKLAFLQWLKFYL